MSQTIKLSEVRRLKELGNHADVKDKPGVYLFLNSLGGSVLYVGRSDKSLKQRIKNRGYEYYSYMHCDTSHEAFVLECILYHEHEPQDNIFHPFAPKRFKSVSFCPKCGLKRRGIKRKS
jgi:excinuclease UvrABC nuclease subunit